MTTKPKASVARWICRECNHIVADSKLLRAPHPFLNNCELIGCPECREIGTFKAACHQAGCQWAGSCGELGPDGIYRWSCAKHSLWAKTKAEIEGGG